MPRTMPAGAAAVMKRGGGLLPVLLLDVQTLDGTLYYFTNVEGSYPMVLGAGGSVAYKPWLKRIGDLTKTRALRTDGGDIALQNLSGNTIDREVAAALDGHEFEGSLAVLRFWKREIDAALETWQGVLGEQQVNGNGDEVVMVFSQLMDPNQDTVPLYSVSDQCIWRYKSPQCGSTNAAATCNKTFSDCQTRGATERFSGIPVTGQLVRTSGVRLGGGGGGGLTGGGGGGDGGPGGGGPTFGIGRD